MRSPYSNPYLSARAKGIFAYYAELGRPVSADEMSAVMPEGRDAIQSAINELKRAGYIITTREQVNGKWNSYMKFTESAKKLLSTDTGFSGLLYVYSDTATATNDNTNSITTNDNTIVEVLRTSTILGAALPKEESAMPWNLDGEEPQKIKPRLKHAEEAEASPGAVGKLVDKKAMRREKYMPQPITHRSNKPEEDWDTKDLVSEFGALLGSSSAGNLTMQLNSRSLSLWVNQQVGKGVSRQNILSAIRMFFEDPRNLHDAGTGTPVWRRFIAYYQSVEGKTVEQEKIYEDDHFLAHQEKMLKLLGGKE